MLNNISERKLIYFLLCAGMVTINFNLAAIAAVIPTISAEFGITDVETSRIVTFYMIPYGLGALGYGWLTRYLTYRAVLGGSLALYAVCALFCGLTKSFGMLLVGNVGMGLTAAGAIPLGLMVIGDLFEKDVRGRLVGAFFGCGFMASLTGILLSGVAPWRTLFYLPAVAGVLTVACLILLPMKDLSRVHDSPVNYWRVFHEPRIRNVFMFIFAMSFLYHGVHKWYGVYLSQIYQLDKAAISLFFTVAAVSGASGQLVGGWITDKKGRRAACRAGALFLALATMALAGKYPLLLLGAIMAVLSLGWTINHNGVSTVLTDFPEEDRPMIAGLNSALRFASGGLGFYLSGFFVEKSFSLTFLTMGVLMFVSSLFLKYVIAE
ncbi:MAG: MFS transporter [Candidatus Omnitrophota bacterium]|nr:MFS transporter [Candidatus Omnitrophota bacterium]MDZ4242189.1 MFS transporter [Candidatus Omnitrophota bacterium]